MSNLNANILNVCKYLQRKDPNGDYLELYQEYIYNEVTQGEVTELCYRVLMEWKEDMETVESLTKADLRDISVIQSYINLLNYNK